MKSILLIGDTNSFMVNAIAKDLKTVGFSVIQKNPVMEEFEKVTFTPDIYLVYLDTMNDFEAVLKALEKKVMEKGVHVCMIGERLQIAGAYDVISEQCVEEVFLRPVNITEMGEKLHSIIAKDSIVQEAKKILVIDDDAMMLKTIKSWLDSKYKVTIVNSGVTAFKYLASNAVDLILLDYEMPVISGPQVFQMLKEDPDTKDIPIMFLTVKSDKESVMKVLSMKPTNYLLKTRPPRELVATIDEFFAENM